MKLLFDQHLSPHLVKRLANLYFGSLHVQTVGLDRASDPELWEYARQADMIIVTKDADFGERGHLLGIPPKVIWIRRGNCSTKEIEKILTEHFLDIQHLAKDPHLGILTLF